MHRRSKKGKNTEMKNLKNTRGFEEMMRRKVI